MEQEISREDFRLPSELSHSQGCVDQSITSCIESLDRNPQITHVAACERGPLTRADGSVRWSQGQCSVMVAVFGPSGTSDSQAAQRGLLSVCLRGRQYEAGSRERELEHKLCQSVKSSVLLNLQPQTSTRIIIQVLQSDGGLLACAFNGACAALVDAGIPLRNMWVSVCCALAPDGKLLVDPDDSEEKASKAVVCATFPCTRKQGDQGWILSVDSQPMCCDSCGKIDVDTFFEAVEICRRGGKHIAEFNVMSMVNRLKLR